jgi:hypothetical protein
MMVDHKTHETEIHALYLSDTVWGELKRRAVMEGSDASKITDYVLRTYLKYMPAVRLPQRRVRVGTPQKLNRRNLHLRKDTWERVAAIAREKKFSISVLTEFLLRNYLELGISDDLKAR